LTIVAEGQPFNTLLFIYEGQMGFQLPCACLGTRVGVKVSAEESGFNAREFPFSILSVISFAITSLPMVTPTICDPTNDDRGVLPSG